MGRLIDEYNAVKEQQAYISKTIDTLWENYQKLQVDYEARLKADMVAMLTEIQLEIEELENPLDYDFEGYNQCAVDCEKLIQQKINAIKEQEDETDKKTSN